MKWWAFLTWVKVKEESKKEKGTWKKLAREHGPVDDTVMVAQESEIGTKHMSKIEALEAEEDRSLKKNRKDDLLIKETAVATGQHCREPWQSYAATAGSLGTPVCWSGALHEYMWRWDSKILFLSETKNENYYTRKEVFLILE